MLSPNDPVEATLFYPNDPRFVLEDLAGLIAKTFASTKIQPQRRLVSDTDLALSVGGLTLTVSRIASSLDGERFKTAQQNALHTGLLRRHRAAIVIRVSGPAGAAKPATRAALCYIAATGMMSLAQAEILHWGETDVLATPSEFLHLRASSRAQKTAQRRRVVEALRKTGSVAATVSAQSAIAFECTARPALAEEDPEAALRKLAGGLPVPRDMKSALGEWIPTLKLQ